MLTATRQDAQALEGMEVIDRTGDKVGKLDDVYFDQQTGRAEWGLVNTGWFGTKESFVPLTTAEQQQGVISVPYEEDQIKNAPKIDPHGELSEQEETELSRYYGLQYTKQPSQTGMPMPGGQQQTRGQGEDVTLSEEQMDVHAISRPSELIRLKKYVVTEPVQQTVPLHHEELKIEREPIKPGQPVPQTGVNEGEIDITLRSEQAVAEKKVVPRERVHVSKETVTEERQVTGEVRKEELKEEREKK